MKKKKTADFEAKMANVETKKAKKRRALHLLGGLETTTRSRFVRGSRWMKNRPVLFSPKSLELSVFAPCLEGGDLG